MKRAVRGDITIGNLEKQLNLQIGTIKNPDGTTPDKNKRLSTLRKEFKKAAGPKILDNPYLKTTNNWGIPDNIDKDEYPFFAFLAKYNPPLPPK